MVFVRHTLPGEVVLARVTQGEAGDRFWRADAVEVLQTAPGRVRPTCQVSGPGGCGGCDWQHAALDTQREIKAGIVQEQLRRLAQLEWPHLRVEAVPGDEGGLAWRSRARFAVDAAGRLGLRRHRSREVVPIGGCPIVAPGIARVAPWRGRWPGTAAVEVVAPSSGEAPLLVVEPAPSGPSPDGRPIRTGRGAHTGQWSIPPLAAECSTSAREPSGQVRRITGRTWVEEVVVVAGVPRRLRVSGAGFWQVHRGAAQTLLDAVLAAVAARPGERALDLYSGAGLFSVGLAVAVAGDGPDGPGSVIAVESDTRAAADARRNLHGEAHVRLEHGRVEQVLPRLLGHGATTGESTPVRDGAAAEVGAPVGHGAPAGAGPAARAVPSGGVPSGAERPDRGVDVVVLDPPRAGAGRGVIERLTAARPRVIAYLACDPAALARDVAVAASCGYRLAALRVFDLFPMTHHVECLAVFEPSAGDESAPCDEPSRDVVQG